MKLALWWNMDWINYNCDDNWLGVMLLAAFIAVFAIKAYLWRDDV